MSVTTQSPPSIGCRDQSDNIKHVKPWYHYIMSSLGFLIPIIVSLILVKKAYEMQYEDVISPLWHFLRNHLVSICMVMVFGPTVYYITRANPVYLVDFSLYHPPGHLQITIPNLVKKREMLKKYYFNESSIEFQKKILERSGLGDETSLPKALHDTPPIPTLQDARDEAEQVIFALLDNLFTTTNLNPIDIDILVVNCSLFNPTPSFSAMIVNRYKLRDNIKSINLAGMGCSASVIAMKLAKDLLQVYCNKYAVVISTEIITPNAYFGNNKSMLISNCLFRVGGTAFLLSNKSHDRYRAKYRLVRTETIHRGTDDKSYRSIYQQEDEIGKIGMSLSRDLIKVAGEAVRKNITKLGPFVLPISEQLLFVGTLLYRKLFNVSTSTTGQYVPDFGLAFDHFCIHSGGDVVIDAMQKKLNLTANQVEASRMALHRFGNTSSSTIWYALGYVEAKGRMRKGHRVWQLAFGAGFMCNSAVWEALRNVEPSPKSPWLSCIDRYPV